MDPAKLAKKRRRIDRDERIDEWMTRNRWWLALVVIVLAIGNYQLTGRWVVNLVLCVLVIVGGVVRGTDWGKKRVRQRLAARRAKLEQEPGLAE